ncbi:helix-turn-helix domain-containing protein [Phaeobacter sp. JH20_36]|jgi:MerR family mercuric resistance operon transcriptional regulator|uniref:Transcriptional regulator n=5 Tax=Rhodobacterales TaxID=204455 RepID=A0AAC9ZDQ5_9RHOB|nr:MULTISPECIES: helix-turn-helix domain-containing protein [Rhodobacterales]AHD11701.1 transcriptional regulator [Phaeobacter gallaeciensis DSM 26640]ATE94965.1 transcriptional regulator [Phaeobacter gallaeciensis]ATE99231.1 transcriptional regulator [Phaeobacter gallaeciensis]ATF03625.1 transcriptional regulator [Phaeobacter gallaeciensis]ATF08394.1 transcriptional regulator [Phaeobacter gallaeciensis]
MSADHAPASELKRSDLARLTGCNLETIRYYENVGLVPDPPRTASGHRRYSTAHVERLNFVMRARDLGFTMEEIRGLLSLVDRGSHTCAEVERMGRHHLEVVRDKIRDLQVIETVLAQTIARCTGSDTPDCPLLDVLSAGQTKSE